jgi:hypothetical protein
MGSSRYFINNELADLPPADHVDPRAVVGGVELERIVEVT